MLKSILVSPMTMQVFAACIGTAAVLGLICALAFRIRSSMSQGFAMSMILLPASVAVVIMLVNGNVGAGLVVGGTFAMVRFRSMQGTAREIVELFIAVVIGVACGMGYLGAAAIMCVLAVIVVLVMTLTGLCAMPTTRKLLKVTLPEHLDYNTCLNEVFAKFNAKATLVSVRTNNMGTLFEVTYDLVLPQGNVPKAFMDEIRVVNSNLAVIVNSPGERDRL